MPKLNQIIAIEKSVKSQSLRELTDAHKMLQKDALLSGIAQNTPLVNYCLIGSVRLQSYLTRRWCVQVSDLRLKSEACQSSC